MSAQAEIYDLGYKRYAGPRRPQSARWRVIMRHQISSAWRGWWRYKLAVGLAVIATVTSAIVMLVYQNKAVGLFSTGGIRMAETVVPLATLVYGKLAMIVSFTISASAISEDVSSGAFMFYFVRSTRPMDYVLGKLAGLYLLIVPIMVIGPLVLGGVQIALTPEGQDAMQQLGTLPRALCVGLLGSLIYSAIPLGISAMTRGRMIPLGAWAIYYILLGQIGGGLAIFVWAPLGVLDLAGSLSQVSMAVYGLKLKQFAVAPTWVMVAAIVVPAVVSVVVAAYKVKHAADNGVGGVS
jgi:hypothetical protein